MAIRTIVTRGYGNGTFNGTIALVVTRGYVGEVDLLARIIALEAIRVSSSHFILKGTSIEVTDEGTEKRAWPATGVEKVPVGV